MWFLLCFLLFSQAANAQFVAPFQDVYGKEYIFNGQDYQFAESLPFDTFLVGKMRCCIPLLSDVSRRFTKGSFTR